MIATDSRGVRYDVSEVMSRAARQGWLGKHPSSSFIIERISDRPVDVKRKERAQRKAEKLHLSENAPESDSASGVSSSKSSVDMSGNGKAAK